MKKKRHQKNNIDPAEQFKYIFPLIIGLTLLIAALWNYFLQPQSERMISYGFVGIAIIFILVWWKIK